MGRLRTCAQWPCRSQPALLEVTLPEGDRYRAEVIDAWGMTVTQGGVYSGRADVPMPGRAYHALVLRRVA